MRDSLQVWRSERHEVRRLAERSGPEDLFLIPAPGASSKPSWPLEPPQGADLFARFAELLGPDGSFADRVVEFADQHGMLGSGAGAVVWLAAEDGQSQAWTGERVRTWATEAAWMHRCVRLWDLLRERDLDGLRACIKWSTDAKSVKFGRAGGVLVGDGPATPWVVPELGGGVLIPTSCTIASTTVFPEDFQTLPTRDVLEAGWVYLLRVLNERLAGRVGVRLVRDRPGAEVSRFVLSPAGLLGGLWLQFAEAVDGNRTWRQCRHCRKRFEDKRRANKPQVYCSATCRVGAHRARKRG